MNTAQKGKRNERKAAELLEKQGFEVARTKASRHGDQDFFNRWDVIACNANTIRFVQVKTNKKVYGKQKAYYASFVCPPNCTKELWVFYDRVKEPFIEII
jgi:Holliday junction resolvase